MNPACTQYQDDWYRVTPGLMYWHNLVLDRSHFYCLFIIILTALGLGLSTPVWSLDVLELVNLSFSMRQVIWYLVWKDLENLFHHVLSEVNQYSSFKMCWSDGRWKCMYRYLHIFTTTVNSMLNAFCWQYWQHPTLDVPSMWPWFNESMILFVFFYLSF